MSTQFSVEEMIAEVTQNPEEIKLQISETKRAMTALKYKAAQRRIEEIDEKIAKLQKERDNLVRKNENRRIAYSKK